MSEHVYPFKVSVVWDWFRIADVYWHDRDGFRIKTIRFPFPYPHIDIYRDWVGKNSLPEGDVWDEIPF